MVHKQHFSFCLLRQAQSYRIKTVLGVIALLFSEIPSKKAHSWCKNGISIFAVTWQCQSTISFHQNNPTALPSECIFCTSTTSVSVCITGICYPHSTSSSKIKSVLQFQGCMTDYIFPQAFSALCCRLLCTCFI